MTDDSIGLNLLFLVAITLNRPVFFPMGSYIIKDTLNVCLITEMYSDNMDFSNSHRFLSDPELWERSGHKSSPKEL